MKTGRMLLTFVLGCLLFVAPFTAAGTAEAMITMEGMPIIAIDGDSDSNVTVEIMNLVLTSPYEYGFFLNGGSTFYSLGNSGSSTLRLQGGDILDFALYDYTKYYTLSGNSADATYNVRLMLGDEVTTGSPQQPAGWTGSYYSFASLYWIFPGTGGVTNELEMTLNFSNGGNDGVAPIPEPGTLILMGSALVGFAALKSRSRRRNG